MQEAGQLADDRRAEFDAQALDYDRFRPRYPASLFADITRFASLAAASTAIEIGNGHRHRAPVDMGIDVTAVEPAPGMAAVGAAPLADRARWIVSRSEDAEVEGPVDLIVSCNAWHWVEPGRAVERVADLVRPRGTVALVWTEVTSWGGTAFEGALAEAFRAPWPKTIPVVVQSRHVISNDERFSAFEQRHRPFSRALDAAAFVAVTRTYGGTHTAERDAVLTWLVDEAGGSVTKSEDAVLYLARRL